MTTSTPDFVRLPQALELMQRINAASCTRSKNAELRILVHAPGTVGGVPSVGVASILPGFDWEAGQLLLRPAQPLTALTPEQVSDITKSVRTGSSWHAYQREKALRERIAALEAEVAALKGAA